MTDEICLILHRKSSNLLPVKEAVKAVRRDGIDLRVRIPWNKKDKPRVVRRLRTPAAAPGRLDSQ